ncbi:MAG: DUF3568 family protein [Candidatus Omnitrophota bacterium]
MKRNVLTFLSVLFLLMNISGCVPLIIGGVAAGAAVGAYAVGNDTMEGDTDKPYDKVWDSALTVAKIRGSIEQENEQTGYIEFVSGSSRVNIKLVRLTRTIARLRVSARKGHFPNIKLAEDIFVKIIEGAG